MDEQTIKAIMSEVLKNLGNNDVTFAKTGSSDTSNTGVTCKDYPLAEHIPERLTSASGKAMKDYSFEKVISGELTAEDFRINPEVLRMQADVADSVGRDGFANNLRRAAELTAIPDDEVLGIYNSLRPYRSTKAELLAIADRLENTYGAKVSADFIREAADVYQARGRLKDQQTD
jgi:propanediol dehydratase small subunit